jgi:hypothetical protein
MFINNKAPVVVNRHTLRLSTGVTSSDIQYFLSVAVATTITPSLSLVAYGMFTPQDVSYFGNFSLLCSPPYFH